MLVFIDDSGDTGFKLEKGSTRYFVIAMVIFDDELEAEKTAVEIKKLRRELGLSENSEFRFFKSRPDVRRNFLQTINPFSFKVRCLVVDKILIRSQELKTKKESFYSYFIKEALKHSGGSVLEAKVRIDGSGDRIFRKSLLSYLRRELNTEQRKIMKNCKMVDSKSNMLIQMADMIAGSINRSYNKDKKDHQLYRKLIAKHITDEWKFK